jgi:hypothetical protein
VQPFQDRIFAGLKSAHQSKGINFAAVNLARLFGQINALPKSFGYTNTVRHPFNFLALCSLEQEYLI